MLSVYDMPLLETKPARERLLEAAGKLFARDGYETPVSRICAEAGANIAAVNYHFGDKRSLYGEVLRVAIDRLKVHCDAGMLDENGFAPTPEARLTALIRRKLHGMLHPDETNWEFAVVMREFMQPSEDQAEFLKGELCILSEECPWLQIVAQTAGFSSDDPRIQWSIFCAIAPSLLLCLNQASMTRHFPALQTDRLDIDAFAAHVARQLMRGLESFAPAKVG